MKKLESRTVKELISLAREWGVSGYSKLKKAELIRLLASKLPKGIKPKAGKTPAKPATRAKAKPSQGTAKDKATEGKAKANPAKAKANQGKASSDAAGKGRRATQAGRDARTRASKARLGERGQQEYVRPKLEPVAEPSQAVPQPVSQASLPARYGDGRMGLLPRDAHWLYCFWDPTAEQFEKLAAADQAALRIVQQGRQGDRQVQVIRLPAGASSWYVHVEDGDRTYRCDLGSLAADGRFEVILSSNPSSTPPDGAGKVPAKATFAPPPGVEAGRKAADSPTGQARRPSAEQSRRLERMADQAGPVGGLDSAAALGGQGGRAAGGSASDSFASADLIGQPPADGGTSEVDQPGFWLQMDADLILYGATVPGASVSLAGIPLQLDPQGHFRARFALPDGGHGFELVAASPDASDERRIQVQVERRTEDPGGRA